MTPTSPTQLAGLADRECQSVWRCAIHDSVSALDILTNKWLGSRRKAEREAGAQLAAVLELLWAARDPAPSNYNAAALIGKPLHARVRFLLQEPPHAN